MTMMTVRTNALRNNESYKSTDYGRDASLYSNRAVTLYRLKMAWRALDAMSMSGDSPNKNENSEREGREQAMPSCVHSMVPWTIVLRFGGEWSVEFEFLPTQSVYQQECGTGTPN